jgi:hypothetical protein
MADKTWLQKYWWIFLVVIVIILATGYFGVLSPGSMMSSSNKALGSYEASYYDSRGSVSGSLYPTSNQDFAPEVQERQLIKTSSISMETKRGEFDRVQSNVNNLVKASGAYVLSDNFQVLGSGSQTYKTNTYQIKIETSKYDSLVAQLRELGGITSFAETATDVTGAITNRQVEIAAEKERLRRYEMLVSSSGNLNDKLLLTDRIFEQDRRIKYLEVGLENQQQNVAYSTISLTLREKAPALYGVALVGFGSLIKTLIGSVNAVLYFLFAILPWALLAGVIYFIIRLIKKRR